MAVQNVKPTPFKSDAILRKEEVLGVAKTAKERADERAKAARDRLDRLRGGFGGQRESLLGRQEAARLETQRAGGRNVARAVASSPFSGATSSIVAAESVQERLDKQQQEAALRGEAALAQLQATQLGQEEAGIQSVEKAEDVALEQTALEIKAREDLPKMAEQHDINIGTETAEINAIIKNHEHSIFMGGDDPDLAAGEIEARALTYKNTDPKMHKMLMHVADAVRTEQLFPFSSTGGIGSNTVISLTKPGAWPWTNYDASGVTYVDEYGDGLTAEEIAAAEEYASYGY